MVESRGVIFDVDGVLVDSYEAHFESWKRLGTESGRGYSRADFEWGFGRTSREVIRAQWDGAKMTDAEVREIDDRKEAYYRELVRANFPEMPGARRLVRALHKAGFRLAVGSSGPPANVQVVIDRYGLGPYLSAVVHGRDVTRGKPDPQVFQLAAGRLGVPPARCVVVEDAPAGIEAARRAGMKCIGVASTGRTPEQLAAADCIVGSLEELDPDRFAALLPTAES
ncbi:MAG: HAD family phosphatase [Planctomycetales bacterium]